MFLVWTFETGYIGTFWLVDAAVSKVTPYSLPIFLILFNYFKIVFTTSEQLFKKDSSSHLRETCPLFLAM